MFVKICGLKNAESVHAAVVAGADAVGCVFASSVRQIDPQQAAEIMSDVPAHVRKVAVMLHPKNDEWLAVLDHFKPDVLQTDAVDFDVLDVPHGVEKWPVYRTGNDTASLTGAESASIATRFVFEGPTSGSGETVDWSVAARLAVGNEMILAGGMRADNVAAAIGIVRPFGVDVSSGVEVAPGEKDPQLIEAFVERAKSSAGEPSPV